MVEQLSQERDALEGDVLEDAPPDDLARLHRIRPDLATLRRAAWPQRETIHDMVRSPSPVVTDDTRTYLHDTDDHMERIGGRLDFCREVAVSLMDLHLSTMGHRQNEIMKLQPRVPRGSPPGGNSFQPIRIQGPYTAL